MRRARPLPQLIAADIMTATPFTLTNPEAAPPAPPSVDPAELRRAQAAAGQLDAFEKEE